MVYVRLNKEVIDYQDRGMWPYSMIGEHRLSLLQMNRLSLRNNQLKFKTAGKLLIVLEEIIEYTQFIKGNLGDVNM